MLTLFDSPRPKRNFADEWLGCAKKPPPMWMVQCVLSRRESFGSVTVTSTSWHAAGDEDEAKLLGMKAAAGQRPDYRLDMVIAKLAEPPA